MASEIVLYDLGSRYPKCWSINPWKSRLALNFKGLSYATEFLQFPEIKSVLFAKGVTLPEGSNKYSVPTIRLPDGKYVMDSAKIAQALEALKPSPSFHLEDSDNIQKAEALMQSCIMAFYAEIAKYATSDLLEGSAKEFLENTVVKAVNKPVDEYHKEQGGEIAWAKAEPSMKELAQFLKKTNGPFVNGAEASYSDIHIVAGMMLFKALDEEKMFDRFLKFDPSFQDLYNASKPWTLKDK